MLLEIDFEERYEHSDALEAQIGEEPVAGESSRPSVLTISPTVKNSTDTTQKVLNFYKELPFNYYSNAVDTAVELLLDGWVLFGCLLCLAPLV